MSREIKKILISTMPRSGTVFFIDFISKLFNFDRVEPELINGIVPNAPEWDAYKYDKSYLKFKDNQVLYGHYQFVSELDQLICDESILTFFLYRDPRDADLSATLYIKNVLMHHQLHHSLSKMSEYDALTFMISGGLIYNSSNELINYEGISYISNNALRWTSKKNVCALRYEDFFFNPHETILNALSKVNVEIDSVHLENTLKEFSFAKFSGGRKRGEEDKSSHFRKGIVGDYKNFYTPIHTAICKKQIGESLIKLGYETDLEWGIIPQEIYNTPTNQDNKTRVLISNKLN
jgi:hypothetical protein